MIDYKGLQLLNSQGIKSQLSNSKISANFRAKLNKPHLENPPALACSFRGQFIYACTGYQLIKNVKDFNLYGSMKRTERRIGHTNEINGHGGLSIKKETMTSKYLHGSSDSCICFMSLMQLFQLESSTNLVSY